MKLITIDMDALAKAIDSNTDANEQEARAIINTVLAAPMPQAEPRTRMELIDLAQTYGATLGEQSGTINFEPFELERFVAAVSSPKQEDWMTDVAWRNSKYGQECAKVAADNFDLYAELGVLKREVMRLRKALSDLLMYCAEMNPNQGDPEHDDPRITAAGAALAPKTKEASKVEQREPQEAVRQAIKDGCEEYDRNLKNPLSAPQEVSKAEGDCPGCGGLGRVRVLRCEQCDGTGKILALESKEASKVEPDDDIDQGYGRPICGIESAGKDARKPKAVRVNRHGQPIKEASKVEPVAVELGGVAEVLAEGNGFWRSCTGCHELNEGHPTGLFSTILKCHLGVGCDECGGIGAIWDDTDYDAMAAFMAGETEPNPSPQALSDDRIRAIADELGMFSDNYEHSPGYHCERFARAILAAGGR